MLDPRMHNIHDVMLCDFIVCHRYRRAEAASRSQALQWLEFFGKWSMLDVIAVIITIVVFDIELRDNVQL